MQSITIANREYPLLLPIEQEQLFDKYKNYLFDTTYLCIISIEGENASEFLQGQLTCDLNKISSTLASPALYCNAKGKIISYFYLYKEHEDKLNLVMPRDLSKETMRVLNRYAPFSRVKVANSRLRVFGMLANHEEEIFNGNTKVQHLNIDKNRFLLIVNSNDEDALWQAFCDKQAVRGAYSWHYLNMKNKDFSLYPVTQTHFFPHRLDLHKTPSISFDKGCYVGQEIIARTHYKAKTKYGLFFYEVKLSKPPELMQDILTIDNRKLGEIVDYCPLSKEDYLLATTLLLEHPDEARLGDTIIYFQKHVY